MKIERKPWIIAGISILVIILLGAWLMMRGGSGFNFTGNRNSDPQSTGPKKLSKYIPVLSAIDREYYTDTYFTNCVSPKVQSCVGSHLKDKPTLATSFVDMMKTLSELPENENFDNCLSDALRTCGDMAVKNRIERSSDASACDTYTDPAIKQSCYNESYPKIAIEKDNPGICNSLTDPTVAKSCLDSYNSAKSVSARDISWCDRMSVDYMQASCKNAFYAAVAKASKDINFCLKSPTKDISASCVNEYIRIAGYTEISQCKILDEYADLYTAPRAKEMAHDQCIDSILNKIVTSLPQNTVPADKAAAYKSTCSWYTSDERKKGCLEYIEIRLKNQVAQPASVTPESTPTPEATSSTSNTPKK